MIFIREHIVFRFLCLVMALNILNYSVDTPDAQAENIPEDLSFNDMESIVEIILEQLLGFDNAIAEIDENDSDESTGITIKKGLDFYSYQQTAFSFSVFNTMFNCKNGLFTDQYSEQFHPEVVPPPPKS